VSIGKIQNLSGVLGYFGRGWISQIFHVPTHLGKHGEAIDGVAVGLREELPDRHGGGRHRALETGKSFAPQTGRKKNFGAGNEALFTSLGPGMILKCPTRRFFAVGWYAGPALSKNWRLPTMVFDLPGNPFQSMAGNYGIAYLQLFVAKPRC